MKRIKSLIKAWTITRSIPTTELKNAHVRMRQHLAASHVIHPDATRDLALFDDLFADAIDIASPKVQADKPTESAS